MSEAVTGRRRFRPTLWATLLTIPALITLVALGSWQWQRLGEKEALIAELKERLAAPATLLPLDLSDPSAVRFLKVKLEGRYLHEREVRLTNRVFNKVVGLHVVTPFALSDGRTILVDRGWVPLNLESPKSRPEGQVGGQREVTAILRLGGFSGPEFLKPVNDAANGSYHWPDLGAMTVDLAEPVTDVFAVLLETESVDGQPLTYPIADPPNVDIPNNHLEYTITWYGLAMVLLVIYILFHIRRESLES